MVTSIEAEETAFVSERNYTQPEFARWLADRPLSDINHYELLNGRIVMNPPASWLHGRTENRAQVALTNFVDAQELGYVLGSSTGYDLPTGDTLQPDVSFISRERFDAAAGLDPKKFARIVPNVVVEILSPSTKTRDLTEKKETYAKAGVDEYWVIDADRREITIFHLIEPGLYDEGRVLTTNDRLNSTAVPGFSCLVRDLL